MNRPPGGLTAETDLVREDRRLMYPVPIELTDKRVRNGDGFGTPVFFYTSRHFLPIQMAGDSNTDESPERKDRYEVRIIDNDYNTYRQVMDITTLALNLSEQQAYAVAWEVDHKGSCVVAVGPREIAESTASIIRTIGIEVQVHPVAAGTA